MTSVQTLYILADDKCNITASNSPLTPSTSIYSLVSVTPNMDGTDVETIQGKYVYGTDPGQEYMFIEHCAAICPILICPGDNLIKKIELNFLDKTADQRCEILNQSIYPGDTDIQRYVNSFVGGVAMTLFTYKIAALDQNEINMPFNPFCPCSPLTPDEVTLEVLTNNLFMYYSYMIAFYRCLPICPIGKLWFDEVYKTFTAWGEDCFKTGPCYNNEVSIYCSIQGFSCYFFCQVKEICHKIEDFEQLVKEAIDKLCQKLKDALEKIDHKIHKFKDLFDKAVCTISTLGMSIIKMIKELWCQCKSDIEETCEKCLKKIDHKCKSFSHEADNMIDDKLSQVEAKIQHHHDNLSQKHEEYIRSLHGEYNRVKAQFLADGKQQITKVKALCQKYVTSVEQVKQGHVTDLQHLHRSQQVKADNAHQQHMKQMGQLHQDIISTMRAKEKSTVRKLEKYAHARDIKLLTNMMKDFLQSDNFITLVDSHVEQRVDLVLAEYPVVKDLEHNTNLNQENEKQVKELRQRIRDLEASNEDMFQLLQKIVKKCELIK